MHGGQTKGVLSIVITRVNGIDVPLLEWQPLVTIHSPKPCGPLCGRREDVLAEEKSWPDDPTAAPMSGSTVDPSPEEAWYATIVSPMLGFPPLAVWPGTSCTSVVQEQLKRR